MSFLEILFPANVSYGAVGGGAWSTRVVVTDSGREYRQSLWSRSRGRWTVGHNLRTPQEWDQLIAFHRIVLGKTHGFRFQDWTDCTDTGRGILALNSKGHIQLAKYYQATDLVSGGVYTSMRLVAKPRPGTIALFHNGAPAPGISVDYTSGLISGTGSIAGYSWTGQFDVPARFDTDEPELSLDLPSGAGWRGIPIAEIRMDDP